MIGDKITMRTSVVISMMFTVMSGVLFKLALDSMVTWHQVAMVVVVMLDRRMCGTLFDKFLHSNVRLDFSLLQRSIRLLVLHNSFAMRVIMLDEMASSVSINLVSSTIISSDSVVMIDVDVVLRVHVVVVVVHSTRFPAAIIMAYTMQVRLVNICVNNNGCMLLYRGRL